MLLRKVDPPTTPPVAEVVTLPALVARTRERVRRRRVIIASIVAVLLVGAALTAWLARPKPLPLSARFRAAPVSHGDVVREVRATGRLDAVASVDVGAEISGRIASVEVDYNAPVKAGQVLARFDLRALEAQRAQTAATVLAAKATLAQARFDLAQAQRNHQRALDLLSRGAMAQSEQEVVATAFGLAKARLEASEANLAAQEATATLARTNLDHAVIRAPIDGVVITRNVDPGQTVTSMLQSPVLFSVAADLRKMEVVAAVDEADIAELQVGQRAVFTVNAYQDRLFEGSVSEVRYAAKILQDVVTYSVVIAVDNLDLALKPSMTASVRIKTGVAHDVDRVPNGAFQFTPPGQPSRTAPGFWTLTGDRFVFVPATPGLSDGEVTAVPGGAAVPSVLIDLTAEGRKAYDAARDK